MIHVATSVTTRILVVTMLVLMVLTIERSHAASLLESETGGAAIAEVHATTHNLEDPASSLGDLNASRVEEFGPNEDEVSFQADTTAPSLDSAIVSGAKLVLTYDEELDEDSTPAASTFSVIVGSGSGVAPSSVAVVHDRVELGLTQAGAFGQSVRVSCTAPTNNPIQDNAGNDVADPSDQVATNILRSSDNALVKNTAQIIT